MNQFDPARLPACKATVASGGLFFGTAMSIEANQQTVEPGEPGGFAHLTRGLLMIWAELPEQYRLILPLLLSFMPDAWPSQSRLGKLAGRSRQTVNKVVGELAAVGLIVKTRRTAKDGRNTSCLYALADLDNAAIRAEVVACMRGYVNSKALHTPMSTPEVDIPCQAQELTYPVKSKPLHTLSSLEVDRNGQGNRQVNGQREEEAASPPGGGFATVPDRGTSTTASSPDQAEGDLCQGPPAPRQVNSSLARTAGAKSPAPRQRSGKRQGKPAPLTDAERQAICESFDALRGFYLFGRGAIGRRPEEWLTLRLAPTPTNWAPSAGSETDYARPAAGVSPAAWAAWAGCQLSMAQIAMNFPRSLLTIGRLIGATKHLRDKYGDSQAAEIIETISTRWAEVRRTLAWMNDLSPTEGALQSAKVVEVALNLLASRSLPPASTTYPIGTNTFTGSPSYAGAF